MRKANRPRRPSSSQGGDGDGDEQDDAQKTADRESWESSWPPLVVCGMIFAARHPDLVLVVHPLRQTTSDECQTRANSEWPMRTKFSVVLPSAGEAAPVNIHV